MSWPKSSRSVSGSSMSSLKTSAGSPVAIGAPHKQNQQQGLKKEKAIATWLSRILLRGCVAVSFSEKAKANQGGIAFFLLLSWTTTPPNPKQTRPRLARKHNIASEVGQTLQDTFFSRTRSIREARLMAPASGSLQVALCKLRSLQVALCKLLCASCSVQVALRKLLCASCSRQGALRKLVGASWSAQVALKCKLHLATPARGPGRNRTRDPPAREQAREPRDNSRGPVRTTKVAKNLKFLHADSRRGSRGHRRNRKKPWVFAPRPRRFPQRVAQAPQKSQKNHGFLHLDHADPRRGSRGNFRNRKKNHRFLHLDHADPRRGSRGNFRHRKKPWVFAPRPRRCPQRVAREL